MAMSELLEGLRTICGRAYICSSRDDCDDYANCWEHRAAIIDAVERELSERYMELPSDVNGVPWHIGDVTENGQTVKAMGLNKHGWYFVGTVNDIDPSIHRHGKPDTWERIIEDALDGYHDTDFDALVARCKALAEENE